MCAAQIPQQSMSESGHEPKSLSWPLCQLPPATADMTSHRPSPLCAITGSEQSQHHSITLSARAMTVGGTVIPSLLAVLRLTLSSNVVGCSIGRSLGFAPLRILST